MLHFKKTDATESLIIQIQNELFQVHVTLKCTGIYFVHLDISCNKLRIFVSLLLLQAAWAAYIKIFEINLNWLRISPIVQTIYQLF